MDFHLPLIFSFDDSEGRKMDNLKQLTLNPDDGEDENTHLGWIGLVDLERISKVAPNLQILTVHYLRSSPSNPLVRCLTPLTHLALYECKLRPSDLSTLFLSVAVSLRSLALIHLSSDGYSASHLPMAVSLPLTSGAAQHRKLEVEGGRRWKGTTPLNFLSWTTLISHFYSQNLLESVSRWLMRPSISKRHFSSASA
ncbi:hypothetical protein BT69DRAFT_1329902 [Atractiella rhizophila]|nr:hypothetical protein BT69DRAFT_1329902 [Atractiella rhizophila]